MNEKLIENLKALMDLNQHNHSVLADKSGISQGTISKILSGESNYPDYKYPAKIESKTSDATKEHTQTPPE